MTARVHKQPSKLRVWFPALLWMGVIWLLSEQPDSGAMTEKYLGAWNILIRKLAHVSEYAILFGLLRRALNESATSAARRPADDGDEPAAASDPARKKSDSANESRQPAKIGTGSGSMALLLSVLYAVSDEWHQSYVPGRSATIQDVLVDTAGACLGLAGVYLAAIVRARATSAAKSR